MAAATRPSAEDSRWELASKYGFLSAGGGSWYWKPLKNLTPGKRVFAHVGGAGYVGVGVVEGEMIPARDAFVGVVSLPQIDTAVVSASEAVVLRGWKLSPRS
jgi:hypothetical protein